MKKLLIVILSLAVIFCAVCTVFYFTKTNFGTDEGRLTEIETAVSDIKTTVNEKMNAQDQKISEQYIRINQQSTQIEGLKGELTAQKSLINAQNEVIKSQADTIKELESKVEKIPNISEDSNKVVTIDGYDVVDGRFQDSISFSMEGFSKYMIVAGESDAGSDGMNFIMSTTANDKGLTNIVLMGYANQVTNNNITMNYYMNNNASYSAENDTVTITLSHCPLAYSQGVVSLSVTVLLFN